MFRKTFVALTLVAIAFSASSCARKPPNALPGTIDEVIVQFTGYGNPGQINMYSQPHLNAIAREAGFFYQRQTPASQKPSREELEQIKSIEASNAKYARYVQRPDVINEMLSRFEADLETALKQAALRPIDIQAIGGSFSQAMLGPRAPRALILTQPGSPPATLFVTIEKARLGIPSFGTRETLGGRAGLLFNRAAFGPTPEFRGHLVLRDKATGAVLKERPVRYQARKNDPLKDTHDINIFANIVIQQFAK